MNAVAKFFHELFHPHCSDCINEKEDSEICMSCETLRGQLNIVNKHNEELIKALLEKDRPVEIARPIAVDEPHRLKSTVPWAVRRQLLEEDSRKKAELLRQAELNKNIVESISDLEKEVGISSTGE